VTWEPAKESYYELRPAKAPKYKVKFEGAGTLTDIPGYVWFSPAALYLWGKFTDVQLSDIMTRKDVAVFWYKFDKPIFKGFTAYGDVAWNHTLWAVAEDKWDRFVDAMLELIMLDRDSKTVFSYALQYLTVLDPLYVDRKVLVDGRAPRTVVGYFAVLTNKYQVAFDKLSLSPGELPQVKTLRPDRANSRVAANIYVGKDISTDRAFTRYRENLLREEELRFQQKLKEFQDGRVG